MLEGFDLLRNGKHYSTGSRNRERTYVFYRKPIALQKLNKFGRNNWKGDIFFSHGSCHSRGTMILVKDHLDFKLVSTKVDPLGRYILIEAQIQDSPFISS